MLTNPEIKIHSGLDSILQSRLYINRLIRFILDNPPEKASLLDLSQDPSFISLSEIILGCQTIQTGISILLADHDSSIALAKEEYNRLFVGPNVLPAPLWESVYLGREHIMFEEQTLQVRECYRQHGLSFFNEKNEPDDHIVNELEFLSYLIEKTLESPLIESKGKYLVDQLTFLDEHLLKWGPSFCELLSEATENNLYKGAAVLLDEYLSLEKELVLLLKEAFKNE